MEAGPGHASGADDFNRWWASYPLKKAKKEARKAFDRCRKAGVALETLVEGVRRYKASKPPDQHWCHPATWLNQARWEDEPADGAATRSADDWDGYRPKANGQTQDDRDRWQAILDRAAMLDAPATKSWLEPLVLDGRTLWAPGQFHSDYVSQQLWWLKGAVGIADLLIKPITKLGAQKEPRNSLAVRAGRVWRAGEDAGARREGHTTGRDHMPEDRP